jgi:prolyl-tRNA synthetase
VSRLLAAVLERHHDERGIVWSPEGALFAVYLVALGEDRPEVAAAAKAAYAALWNAGLETLYDEREETAGVKFMDADVLGLPLRLTVSRRSVASGGVELKERATGALRMRPLAEVVAGVQAALGTVARVR